MGAHGRAESTRCCSGRLQLLVGLLVGALIGITFQLSWLKLVDGGEGHQALLESFRSTSLRRGQAIPEFANVADSSEAGPRDKAVGAAGDLAQPSELEMADEAATPAHGLATEAQCMGSGRNTVCLYRNFYFADGKFFMATTKDSKLHEMHRNHAVGVGMSKFAPLFEFGLQVFDTENALRDALLGRKNLVFEQVEGTSLVFKGIFTQNIGHLLFDTLYPIFTTAMRFHRHQGPLQFVVDSDPLNCKGEIPLKVGETVFAYTPNATRSTGRSFRPVRVRILNAMDDKQSLHVEVLPGQAVEPKVHAISVSWVDRNRPLCGEGVMSTFSGREVMYWTRLAKDSQEEPGLLIKFDTAITGTGMVGNLVMTPSSVLGASGAPLYATARYRERMLSTHGVDLSLPYKRPKVPRLIIVDNKRFSADDKNTLRELANQLTVEGAANAVFIDWPALGDFAAHIRYVSEVDIYVSAPGTALQYAPLMRDGAVFVALGHRMERLSRIVPSFMEQQLVGGGTPYLRVLYADQRSIMDGECSPGTVSTFIDGDHVMDLLRQAASMVATGFPTPVPWKQRVSTEARLVQELCDLDPLTCQLAFAQINADHGPGRCHLDNWPELMVYEVGPWSSAGWSENGTLSKCPVNRTLLRKLRRKYSLPGFGAPYKIVPQAVSLQEAKWWWHRDDAQAWARRNNVTLPSEFVK